MVDLILTDPPYNISRDNNFSTIGRNGIDFGEWDKNFNQLKWLNNIGKIVNKDGSIIIFNDWKNMGLISNKLEKEGFIIKDLIRWVKPAPMPRNTNRRYVTDFEFAVWAVKKGSKWTFNKGDKYPYLRPSYSFSPPMGSKRIHPTEKPIELLKEIIKVHSNKGDVVFDPFSGSGAISNAAFDMDRFYIGSELNKKYWELSCLRLKKLFIKPAFNHLGNKSRMIEELIRNFPKKDILHFVEPFAGSGIVSLSYQSSEKYWLNDNDKHLSSVLEYLFNTKSNIIIKDMEEIIKKYKLPIKPIKNYAKEYNLLKKSFNKDKLIPKLLVLIIFGFNQQIRFNSKGEFNIPMGKFYWNDYHKDKIKNFIKKCEIKNFEICSVDFEVFVDSVVLNFNPQEALFYFDPPYLLSSATYNDCWNEEDEKRLINCLESLTKKGYKWCLSNLLISKGKRNNYLNDFISNNSNLKYKYIEKINYNNSNYQRKKTDEKDIEILVWGNYNV